MKVTIVGIGLIGGSLALKLKSGGFANHVIGVDNNYEHISYALESGMIDESLPLPEAVRKSDLVLLATPVDVIEKILPEILNLVTQQVVTDMGSTKSGICQRVENHKNRARYVPSHPMAGTEYSGPRASDINLFCNKVTIICDAQKSDHEATDIIRKMYHALEMRIIEMDSIMHDVHCAYVSHISHISSFALALAVLDKEKDEKNILDLAGGGFESTVRLAKSSSDMWVPVFKQNKENIVEVLDLLSEKLQMFKSAMINDDDKELNRMINKSNKIRKILENK